MMTKRIKGETLLEVVTSVTIITIVMSGVIVLTSQSYKYNTESRARTLAVAYAEEAIEIGRGTSRGCSRIVDGDNQVSGDKLVPGGTQALDNNLFRSISIQKIGEAAGPGIVANDGKVPDGQEANFRYMTVTVDYRPGGASSTSQYTLNTYGILSNTGY